jgi:hypothetical protein
MIAVKLNLNSLSLKQRVAALLFFARVVRKIEMKFAIAILFTALFSSCILNAEEPATVFKLSGWTYGRERKTITGSNRVTASITVKNATKSGVSDVVASLTYTTGLGEKIAGPLVQKINSLKSGESKTLTFVAELVPAFQGYTISMQYNGGKKEEWFGNSDVAQPEPKSELMKGEANVVILGKETSIAKNGVFSGTVHVKNEGTEEATNLKIFVTFFDMRKNKVKDWNAPLGSGSLAGGADKKIPFSISGAPINYGSVSIKLNNDDVPPEAALSGGEFTTVQDVEFAHFKFHKAESGSASIKVEAQCRNGMKAAVDHVKLEMIFYDGKKKEVKRFSHEVPGAIGAGEIKDVAFDIPNLPQYEEYEQRITFGKAPAAAPKTPTQSGPLKFQEKPDVEIVFGQPIVNSDKVLELKGAVRNGKSVSVKDIQIHVTFTKTDGSELTVVDRTLSSTLKPGDTKDFTFYSDKAAGAANFTFTFKFTELN